MIKKLILVVSAVALTGCMALRVSQQDHDQEIASLNLTGAQFKDAMAKAQAAGFSCHAMPRHRPGQEPTLEALCFKRTPELWCPQERRVTFDADAGSGIVANVSTRIIDKSCW